MMFSESLWPMWQATVYDEPCVDKKRVNFTDRCTEKQMERPETVYAWSFNLGDKKSGLQLPWVWEWNLALAFCMILEPKRWNH